MPTDEELITALRSGMQDTTSDLNPAPGLAAQVWQQSRKARGRRLAAYVAVPVVAAAATAIALLVSGGSPAPAPIAKAPVVSDPQRSRICREVEQRSLVGDSERPVLQLHRGLGGRSASGCQAAEYSRLPRSVWRYSRREPEVLPPDRAGSGQLPPERWVGRDDNRRRRADGRSRQADLRPERLTRTRELVAAVVAAGPA